MTDGAQALLRAGALRPDVVLVSASLPVVGAVEFIRYQVRVGGRTVHLPPREFELLRYPMRNARRAVTRAQIMRDVWHSTDAASTNTIAVHVKRLRARLGDGDDQLIQTVHGAGYRLVGRVS